MFRSASKETLPSLVKSPFTLSLPLALIVKFAPELILKLFTKYREDVNEFDELIFRNFASFQSYIFVKGNPMPFYLEC